jgi:hypothetical protein
MNKISYVTKAGGVLKFKIEITALWNVMLWEYKSPYKQLLASNQVLCE